MWLGGVRRDFGGFSGERLMNEVETRITGGIERKFFLFSHLHLFPESEGKDRLAILLWNVRRSDLPFLSKI